MNTESNEQLKKSEYEVKREQKLSEQGRRERGRSIQRISRVVFAIVILAGVVGGIAWYIITRPATPQGEIISSSGIHWHPHLAITIKGKSQEIPTNIGFGVVEQSLHTHDTSGTLHLEIPGIVKKDDIKLGRFFTIWGKQFTSTCIFDSCTGKDGTLTMLVNGKANTEFGNYEMKDGDKIEIRFE